MILHGLFGNVEIATDFLIAQPALNQRDQLLFPTRQRHSTTFSATSLAPLRYHIVEENSGVIGGTHCLPLRYDAHYRDDVGSRGFLENVTTRTTPHRAQEMVLVILHGNKDTLRQSAERRCFAR